jgi:hypothetical protein
MNKETRIFIAGFFWMIVGAWSLSYNLRELVNYGYLFWWEYILFISGGYLTWIGCRMIAKTTEE